MPSATAEPDTLADDLRAEAARLAELIGDPQLAALGTGVPPAVSVALTAKFAQLQVWLREQLDAFETFAVIWDERPLNHHPQGTTPCPRHLNDAAAGASGTAPTAARRGNYSATAGAKKRQTR